MHNYNIVYGTCIGTCAPLCFFLYATPSLAQAQFSHRIPYYGRHAFTPSLTTKSSEECEFYLTLAYLTLLFHHDYCSCDDTRVLRVKTSNRRPWVFTHTLIWCLLFSSPLQYQYLCFAISSHYLNIFANRSYVLYRVLIS